MIFLSSLESRKLFFKTKNMKIVGFSILLVILIGACVGIGFLWGIQKNTAEHPVSSKEKVEHVIQKIEPFSADVKNKNEPQDKNDKKVASKK